MTFRCVKKKFLRFHPGCKASIVVPEVSASKPVPRAEVAGRMIHVSEIATSAITVKEKVSR